MTYLSVTNNIPTGPNKIKRECDAFLLAFDATSESTALTSWSSLSPHQSFAMSRSKSSIGARAGTDRSSNSRHRQK